MSELGGLEAGTRERGAVWRAKLKTKPVGLGFSWTCKGGVRDRQGGLCGAVDGRVSKLGGAGGRYAREGGGLACETKNRALQAQFRPDLQERGEGWTGGLMRCRGWASEQAGGAGGRCA